MLEFFIDPVLRGPTIASMLMCAVAALAGVIVYLRKESLVGEALSHATYPGVIVGAVAAAFFGLPETGTALAAAILVGAFFSALLGLLTIHFLQTRLRVPGDAALCLVLSVFFGVGVTLASHVQFTHTRLYPQIQVYLYGQAATMTDLHILIYAALALLFLVVILFLYKELQVITLDRTYAKSLGIRVRLIDTLLFLLIVLSIVIGIRSVGVVLMSAMLIAPAAAARQYTQRLSWFFALSAVIGLVSGFLGNYLSVGLTSCLAGFCPRLRVSLPTGPMIVLVAATICFISLLFAKERGLLVRYWRILRFRSQRLKENLFKQIWRAGKETSIQEMASFQNCSLIRLYWTLFLLKKSGWLKRVAWQRYTLTAAGKQRAARIVRLHRLWEVYLVEYLDVGAERVHCDAEEMEHILTPELEKQLTQLLDNPLEDPHQQPIPPKDAV